MEVILSIVILLIISYGAIQFFEITALFGRVAGIRTRSAMLGYSVQNAVYMATRLFLVALLPLLGLVIDLDIEQRTYETMAHASLAFATLLGCVLLSRSSQVLSYYISVIKRYQITGNFISSFFSRSRFRTKIQAPRLIDLARNKKTLLLLCQANLVYLVYSTGVFASFYFALAFPNYSTSISQMSGAINAFGAVLLTFFIEPKISTAVDTVNAQATDLVFCLIWSRLLSTGIFGQAFLFSLFNLV